MHLNWDSFHFILPSVEITGSYLPTLGFQEAEIFSFLSIFSFFLNIYKCLKTCTQSPWMLVTDHQGIITDWEIQICNNTFNLSVNVIQFFFFNFLF